MAAGDWRQRLDLAHGDEPVVAKAHTFIKKWSTASQPVLVGCDDNGEYVVKGSGAGRMVVNDQVVARLGELAGAPVGLPALVEIPQELIDSEQEMQHMAPGIWHGTAFLTGCSERQSYEHAAEAANQPRFAALAYLFGWFQAGDHQFVYEDAPPHLVHSVDHGHFFPGGPNWDVLTLAAAAPPTVDANVESGASLTQATLDAARAAFRTPSDEEVARVVAIAPPAWGLSESESVALCDYIANRRDVLFS